MNRISLFLISACIPFCTAIAQDEMASALQISAAFENVAKEITPSVVSVQSSSKPIARKVGPRGGGTQDPFFDPFKEFFGDDFMDKFQAPEDKGGQQGLGTGVVISADGIILTNHHVAGEADSITVKTQDGKTYKAERIGTDARSDICVLKVKGANLQPAKLGDSDNLKIGEWVVAAGNPFGLDNSITAGIVSAKGRSIMGGGQFEDFIQTDAAINPGNSGGPLVNLKGEVIGINTAIFSRSGGYMGIGFAIPVKMAKNVLDSIMSKGKVVRGWLGVSIQNLTEDLSSSFQHQGTEGALVGQVQDKTPAAKAGIKQGDIITKFNGEDIKNVNQLRNLVAGTAPGSNVPVEVIREGEKKTLTATVEELPATLTEEGEPASSQVSADVGLNLENLTPDIAHQLRTKRTEGIVVTGVVPGSIAQESGIQPRDIIVSINGKPIKSVKEFNNLVDEKALKKGLRLVVETQNMERFVYLKSDE